MQADLSRTPQFKIVTVLFCIHFGMDDVAVMVLNLTGVKKKDLQPNETVELLPPLIDLTMESCSISALKDNPEKIIEQIKVKGKPMKLTHRGRTVALLCDLSVYNQTETRRQRLVALLEGVPEEFIPTIGHRPMSPSEHQTFRELRQCVAEIERLERNVNSHKCRLYDDKEKLDKANEKERKLMSAIVPISFAKRAGPGNLKTA